MKHFHLSFLLLPVIAGCLSSAPQAPTNWTIDMNRSEVSLARDEANARASSVRVSAVDVRAPYSGQRLVVLRPDGSMAFDAFNVFASSPATLLRGAACDAVEASGKFGYVLPAGSVAQASCSMELVVTDLALDCRQEGKRTACVGLTLMLLQGREVTHIVRGAGVAELREDYSAAFSTAFAQAMRDALGQIQFAGK